MASSSSSRSFMQYVEQEIGKFPHFVVYAILEWVMIIFLFVDGFFAFVANEYAKFFDLKVPCLLCARIDHVLIHRNLKSYYNESICDLHKRDISSLAYCHVHRKLSDIKTMCEGCLLSFATTERESDTSETLHKDAARFNEEGQMINLKAKMVEGSLQFEIDGVPRCSCCGELLKARPSSTAYNRSFSSNRRLLQQVHATSPRATEQRYMELPHIRELKFVSDFEAELPEDDDGYRAGREENKSGSMPSVPESDDMTEDVKTPTFARSGNRFFGIPLTDSPLSSPKWASRLPKKLQLDKSDLLADQSNDTSEAEGGDSLLHRLKRQVRLDRKTLIALYMELDEERSASAVAANNAMAMITRLQADKAAVQMEALQYQRLMEEQAEYDQEALQVMKEEVKGLEAELDAYREKYGPIDEVDDDEDFQDLNSPSLSSDSGGENESSLDFESERSFLLGMLKNLEKKLNTSTIYEDIYSEPSSEVIECKTEDTGTENKANLRGEVLDMRERLRAMEADSGFLQHAAMTLEKGNEGTKLLKEIALHLRKLRQAAKVPSEDAESC